MNSRRYYIVLACALIFISIVLFIIDYLIFGDLRDNLFYLFQDLAFLPLQVLIVGIVLERILAQREKEEKFQKLNMVVGAFFSEVGNKLSSVLIDASDKKEEIINNINVRANWKDIDFKRAINYVRQDNQTGFDKIDLPQLKSFLISKRSFLLALIENPNLLEHESFTDLLLAVFHLTEELETRPSLDNLPDTDLIHIALDIKRAYQYLVVQWLAYMQHLRTNYPFLYSHYLRIHPFQPNPSAIVV
ncbi:MAG: hypothetical protein NT082_02325 [Chloroflexi bacterium]|nr:hypothetical protein [Chloroflexota bacterium]